MAENYGSNALAYEDLIYNEILDTYNVFKENKEDSNPYLLMLDVITKIDNAINNRDLSKTVLKNALILILSLFFDSKLIFNDFKDSNLSTEDRALIKRVMEKLLQEKDE